MLFIVVNAGAAYVIARERWPGALSEEDELLYQCVPQLSRAQFKMLLSRGERASFVDQAVLTQESKYCDKLYFMVEGHAHLFIGGAHVANAPSTRVSCVLSVLSISPSIAV